MRSNGSFRALLFTTILALLTIMAAGCGSSSSGDGSTSTSGTSSNAAAGDASATSTSSLPPDVVVMVNGKQFTKTDLEEAKTFLINRDNYYIQAGATLDQSGAAEIEERAVAMLVSGEVYALEAQRQGITVSQAEIDAKIASDNASGYPPSTNDQKKIVLVAIKLGELAEASMPPTINPETDINAYDDYMQKWLDDLMKKYDIVYADQYKPKTTTSTTATSTSP